MRFILAVYGFYGSARTCRGLLENDEAKRVKNSKELGAFILDYKIRFLLPLQQ